MCAVSYLLGLTICCFVLAAWQIPLAILLFAVTISVTVIRPQYDLEQHLSSIELTSEKEQERIARTFQNKPIKKNSLSAELGKWLLPGGEASSKKGIVKSKANAEVRDDPKRRSVKFGGLDLDHHYLNNDHDARKLVHDSWTVDDEMEDWSQTDTLLWINDLCSGIADQIASLASTVEKVGSIVRWRRWVV
jgi:hypothetical protein